MPSSSILDPRRAAVGAIAALVFIAPTADAQQQPPGMRPPSVDTVPRPAAKPDDVASPDAIIKALYDVISGPAGQKRDWDRMRSLFVPHARLIPTQVRGTGAGAVVLSVDDYIERAGPGLERNGFFERELARKTESFGNIMHVFSTYDSKRTAADEKPFARGINSIQLLKDGNRWWVVSVFWDSEREGNPIPEKYLK
jgi:hypothetical protein